MCTTCGCGHPDQVRIGELPHVHNDSNAQHATKLPNFSHSAFRMPDSPQQDETQQRLLKVEQDILGANNQLADMNRRFSRINIFWHLILFQVQVQAKQLC